MSISTTSHSAEGITSSAGSRQLLWTVLASFIVPIAVIAALVVSSLSVGKVQTSPAELDHVILARIAKVGSVAIRDANREMKTGEQVFTAQCSGCHAAGVVGAPKFGDVAAWSPRIKTGFDALLNSALKGKNAMAPQGGGAFDNFEIARAVVYMANSSGAKFPEPVNNSGSK